MDSKRRNRTQAMFIAEQLDGRVLLSTTATMSFDHILKSTIQFGQLDHQKTTTQTEYAKLTEDHKLSRSHHRFDHRTNLLGHPRSHVKNVTFVYQSPSQSQPTVSLPIVIAISNSGSTQTGTQGGIQQAAQSQPTSTSSVTGSSQSSTGNTGESVQVTQNLTSNTPTQVMTLHSFPSPPLYQPPLATTLTNAQQNKLGNALTELYNAYEKGGTSSAATVAQEFGLEINGELVSVDVRTAVTLTQLGSDLTNLSMQDQTQYPSYATIQGQIAISQLGNLASLADATSISPVYTPVLHAAVPQFSYL